ncbi:hypothetical protein lerEdw1_007019 [Lerista edwardsae]|nr:hypothetical protein lerEdw1_007019 [Lerista edwardsae]
MLSRGACFLHCRLVAPWGPHAVAKRSMPSKPAPQAATATTAAQKSLPPRPLLSLDDGKVFRLKSNWEVTRGLLVFLLCSSPWLVRRAPTLLSAARRILGRQLWSSLLRCTLYGQFVAGETQEEIKDTLQRLQHLGVRPLLAVPIEEDVGQAKEGEGWYDENARSMLICLDLSVGGAANPMMQLKVTALMAAELCKTITLRLQKPEGASDLTIERVVRLMKGETVYPVPSLLCLHISPPQHAVEKGVRVLVDAEYTYVNPALTLVTLAMMAAWNTQHPWIWNTYQAYLKDTQERMKKDVALTDRLGKERKLAKEEGYPDPVHPNWEATNESYQHCLNFALDRVAQARGRFELIVATHNETSVLHAVQRMAEMGIDKGTGPINFGQLLGMCDQVSLALGQAGYAVYKSIPYGSVEEVIPYLIRRAHENQSVLLGIRKERDLLCLELRRRILRQP